MPMLSAALRCLSFAVLCHAWLSYAFAFTRHVVPMLCRPVLCSSFALPGQAKLCLRHSFPRNAGHRCALLCRFVASCHPASPCRFIAQLRIHCFSFSFPSCASSRLAISVPCTSWPRNALASPCASLPFQLAARPRGAMPLPCDSVPLNAVAMLPVAVPLRLHANCSRASAGCSRANNARIMCEQPVLAPFFTS